MTDKAPVEVIRSGDHLTVTDGRTIVKVGEPGSPDNLAAAVEVLTVDNAVPDICSGIISHSGHRIDALPAGGVIHSGIADKLYPDKRFSAQATTTFGKPVQITVERHPNLPPTKLSIGEVVKFISAIPFRDIVEKLREDDESSVDQAPRHSL